MWEKVENKWSDSWRHYSERKRGMVERKKRKIEEAENSSNWMRSSKNNFFLSFSLPVRRWSNLRRQNFRSSLPLWYFSFLTQLDVHCMWSSSHLSGQEWFVPLSLSLSSKKKRKRKKDRKRGERRGPASKDGSKKKEEKERRWEENSSISCLLDLICVSVFRTKDAKCVTSCGEEKEEEWKEGRKEWKWIFCNERWEEGKGEREEVTDGSCESWWQKEEKREEM